MPVTFGKSANFRVEELVFEVVDFEGWYDAVFGRPAFIRFMAIANYTCLKLKMSGPRGVITVQGSLRTTRTVERKNGWASTPAESEAPPTPVTLDGFRELNPPFDPEDQVQFDSD